MKVYLQASYWAQNKSEVFLKAKPEPDPKSPTRFTTLGDHAGLQYLKKAKDIFVKWKASGTTGLTDEILLSLLYFTLLSVGVAENSFGYSWQICLTFAVEDLA